jgi:Cytochrome c554 and c-prime
VNLSASCLGAAFSLGLLAACTDPPAPNAPAYALNAEELLDPRSCKSCHPGQFEEWEGSMHAFAASDPVFLAMNRRGQEETNGKLGNFCVNCHAPMAVQAGLTDDGLNLPELPYEYQGVTCYFCHSANSVDGAHNNPLKLRTDGTLVGPFDDPKQNPAHASAYATLADSKHKHSSAACGACHDVKVGPPISSTEFNLERTFEEYQATLFGNSSDPGQLSCNDCHMPISPRRSQSAVGSGMPERTSRRHDFEGIDTPTEGWPGRERQQLLISQFLGATLIGEICVSQFGVVEVTLENAGAGHHFPSGASHDRLAWLDLHATTVDSDTPIALTRDPEAEDAAAGTRSLALTDTVLTADGSEAHMFWEAAELAQSTTLPGLVTRDPLDPAYHLERASWRLNAEQNTPDSITRVELTVRIRPIKLAVLNSLVASGHLGSLAEARQPDLSAATKQTPLRVTRTSYGVQTPSATRASLHFRRLSFGRARKQHPTIDVLERRWWTAHKHSACRTRGFWGAKVGVRFDRRG